MSNKCIKTFKFLATTTLLLLYLTTPLFNQPPTHPTHPPHPPHPPSHDAPPTPPTPPDPTIRTLIAYSHQFRLKKDLQDAIHCDAPSPPGPPGPPEGPRWTHDHRLGIYALSAYHDRRQQPFHYVRVVALLRRNASFYCQLCHETDNSVACITRKAITHEVWAPQWGPKSPPCDHHYPAIISCPDDASRPPSFVTFVDGTCSGTGIHLRVTPPPRGPSGAHFVVCVKPLNLTELRPRDLVEWVDINLRLGADKIVFYGAGDRGPVAGNYTRGPPVEWREFGPPQQWRCPPRSFEESVWHKRKMEIIAYNDCFYSNLYYTKFVIPLDVDEIIVPKTGNDWLEAFRSHFGKLSGGRTPLWPPDTENYASFSVRNAYFFQEYPKDAIFMLPGRSVAEKLVRGSRGPGERAPPGESPFARTLRSFRFSPNGDSVKSFVHVGNTLSVFNHYAFHVLEEGASRQVILPESVFQLNHYRNSCDPVLIDGCREFLSEVVYDDSLERFRRRGRNVPDKN